MYFQFSIQHMWRISTHLHTEIISVQVSYGKNEGTKSGSYSEHTGGKKDQRVNLEYQPVDIFASVLQQQEIVSSY